MIFSTQDHMEKALKEIVLLPGAEVYRQGSPDDPADVSIQTITVKHLNTISKQRKRETQVTTIRIERKR